MVNNMPNTNIVVKIDAQGRIVIPAKIRQMLNLTPGSKLILKVRGNSIILTKYDDLEKRIQVWYEATQKMKIEAFTAEIESTFKWMSEDYVKKKLGLN